MGAGVRDGGGGESCSVVLQGTPGETFVVMGSFLSRLWWCSQNPHTWENATTELHIHIVPRSTWYLGPAGTICATICRTICRSVILLLKVLQRARGKAVFCSQFASSRNRGWQEFTF